MSAYRTQLAPALRALTLPCDTSYAWFGRRSAPLTGVVRAELTADQQRDHLAAHVADELYASFYLRGRPVRIDVTEPTAGRYDESFVAALSDANCGSGGWEGGWHLASVDGEGAVVLRDGLRVRLRAGDWRPAAGDGGGLEVELPRPKGYRTRAPGFYLARSDADRATSAGVPELRVYFHPTPDGAVTLMATATRLLNDAGLGFVLKIVNDPQLTWRCDAAVLYLRPDDYERALPALRAMVTACARQLQSPEPAFTKPLARGVAIGEHAPDAGPSFGTTRCRLVAEAVVAARRRRRTPQGLLDAVAERFAAGGLDLDRPYLVAGSEDRYDL